MLACLILSAAACSRGEASRRRSEPAATSAHEINAAEYRRNDYSRARAAARAWLDALDVDPVELSRHGIKGKKKLAEILDCYLALMKCPFSSSGLRTRRIRTSSAS
jgi:hypothetical protein